MLFQIGGRWSLRRGLPRMVIRCLALSVTLILLGGAAGQADPYFIPYEEQPILYVGEDPFTLTTGQLAGGPWTDIAVAHQEGAKISIIENNDGQMEVGQVINTNFDPFFILAGDFNGDGKDDLAVTNTHEDRVELYVQMNPGGLVRFGSYDTGDGPWNMGKGDFDGDGFLDLMVSNAWDEYINVFYGSQLGFTRSSTCNCGYGTGTVVPIHLDGDPFLDAVALLHDSGIMSFMTNDGFGNLVYRDLIYVGSHAKHLVVSDLNHDTFPDLVVLTNDPYSEVDYLTSFLNDGTGHFTTVDQCDTGSYPVEIIADDFNGNGEIELAVLAYEEGEVFTYYGNGEGEFAPEDFLATAPLSRGLGVLDFDWDGRRDLVVSSRESQHLYFLRNRSSTTTGGEAVTAPGIGLSAYPNPFNPSTTITYHLEQGEDLSLELFDIGGRRIRTLLAGEVAAGNHTVKWDGHDENGDRSGSGIYLLRIRTTQAENTLKLVLLK